MEIQKHDPQADDAIREARVQVVGVWRQTFEEVRQREVGRHAGRFEEAGRDEIDHLTRRIVEQVLAVPAARLRAACTGRSDGAAPGAALLARLFVPLEDTRRSGAHD